MKIRKMAAVLALALAFMLCASALGEEQTPVYTEEVTVEATVSPAETPAPQNEEEAEEPEEETQAPEEENAQTPEPSEQPDANESEAEKSEEEENAETPELPLPKIELVVTIEGGELVEGAQVTITAKITGVAEGAAYTLQWSNDITGEMTAVEGEIGESITFAADELNTSCIWQIDLTLIGSEDAGE